MKTEIQLRLGDIVVNGWAGKNNPLRIGIFIRRKKKSIICMTLSGECYEPLIDDHRLKVIGNCIDEAAFHAAVAKEL